MPTAHRIRRPLAVAFAVAAVSVPAASAPAHAAAAPPAAGASPQVRDAGWFGWDDAAVGTATVLMLTLASYTCGTGAAIRHLERARN